MNDDFIHSDSEGTADIKSYANFGSQSDATVVEQVVRVSRSVDGLQPQRASTLRVIDGRLFALSPDSPPSARQPSQ